MSVDMPTLSGQHGMPPHVPFDIFDGFAITLILMLFMVLGAVALVARHFRQRERWAQEEEAMAFNQLLDNEPPKKPEPSRKTTTVDDVEPDTWERDPDWWQRENP